MARGTLWVVGLLFCFKVSGEEAVAPNPKPVCSLFVLDAPVIPATVDEMLPRHMRPGADTNSLPSATSSTNGPALLMAFSTGLDGEMGTEFDARMERLYRKLDEGGHLERRHKTDNRLVRAMDAVFSPEVIQIGTTQIAFSPYTAIKRKNPFCLLNPVPIAVSW